ncbi:MULTISPECIES: hypothetical protein [Nostocales]|uniref:OAA-family lectin sugar binding domain-containing protein n=2 Tax=Tolypothrix TaxID=111782 RepID=A0A0C1R1Z9_9CYAN
MTTYSSQIQFGGLDVLWYKDADVVLEIKNRQDVIPYDSVPATGTVVIRSRPNRNGRITFFDNANAFLASAQFPGKGLVGYRGQLQ